MEWVKIYIQINIKTAFLCFSLHIKEGNDDVEIAKRFVFFFVCPQASIWASDEYTR